MLPSNDFDAVSRDYPNKIPTRISTPSAAYSTKRIRNISPHSGKGTSSSSPSTQPESRTRWRGTRLSSAYPGRDKEFLRVISKGCRRRTGAGATTASVVVLPTRLWTALPQLPRNNSAPGLSYRQRHRRVVLRDRRWRVPRNTAGAGKGTLLRRGRILRRLSAVARWATVIAVWKWTTHRTFYLMYPVQIFNRHKATAYSWSRHEQKNRFRFIF